MNELTRTLTFVGTAVLSLVAAVFLAPSVPRQPDEFADVGQPFYADFDALDASQLRVVSYNEATATAKEFSVALKDGLWQIASHNNYPADGKDRLAKTAASVIGIKREEFRSRNPDDYEELGVIDPLLEDTTKLKGRGERITLKNVKNEVLADYIIGNEVKNRAGFYYVRRPDEKSVYVAKLDTIDVSTRFSDWIEADLLKATADEIRRIAINKYSIDEAQRRIVDREFNELTRVTGTDPWKLDELNVETEEVNEDSVKNMVEALDNLKIVGVRKKPEGLSQDLKLDQGISLDAQTMLDLSKRGFMFAGDGNLLSNEGEMIVGLANGVSYVLRFGEVFSGTELEAERGLAAADSEKKDEKGSKDQLTESRYLFVTAQFDPDYLGEKPVPPVKPSAAPKTEEKPEAEKPEAEKPAETPKPDEAEKADDAAEDAAAEDKAAEDAAELDSAPEEESANSETADAEPKDDDSTEKPAESDPAETPKPAETETEEVTPEQLQEEYEDNLKAYETAIKEYDEKVEKGQELVKELNQRFADWYYVISADSFNKLRLARIDLVKEKEQVPPEEKPETPETESPDSEKPDAEKPEATTPDSEKPEEAKPEAVKPEENKPDAPKPDVKTEKPDPEKPEATKPETPDDPKAETSEPEKPEDEKPEAGESPATKSDEAA